MSFTLKKVAVLGTGVMGGQIAAHLSNAGIEVLAYDIDQETAESGLKFTQEVKPAAFYNKSSSKLITCSFTGIPLIVEVIIAIGLMFSSSASRT